MNPIKLFLLLFLLQWTLPVTAQQGGSHCAFDESVKHARPTGDGGPTQISVRSYLIDIVSIDDADQSFSADIFFRFSWRDERLSHGSQASCTARLSEVWQPGILILNRRGAEPQLEAMVEIEPNGTVHYRQRYLGTFSLFIDLNRFPFDRQVLPLNLVVPLEPEQATLVADTSLFARADTISITNWRIGEPQSSGALYEVMPGMEIPHLEIIYPAKRRSGYYVWKLIIPMSIVVFMSWAVFWISPQHIAPRVGLAATSMLTLIAFRLALGNTLPPIAYLTKLDLFTIGATALVFMALMQTVVSTAIWDRGDEEGALGLSRKARIGFPALLLVISAIVFID